MENLILKDEKFSCLGIVAKRCIGNDSLVLQKLIYLIKAVQMRFFRI